MAGYVQHTGKIAVNVVFTGWIGSDGAFLGHGVVGIHIDIGRVINFNGSFKRNRSSLGDWSGSRGSIDPAGSEDIAGLALKLYFVPFFFNGNEINFRSLRQFRKSSRFAAGFLAQCVSFEIRQSHRFGNFFGGRQITGGYPSGLVFILNLSPVSFGFQNGERFTGRNGGQYITVNRSLIPEVQGNGCDRLLTVSISQLREKIEKE
ncbi:hypothetical protein DSECCO2_199270 [anaerobic digester metagenome]